jgi:hypothetical protein
MGISVDCRRRVVLHLPLHPPVWIRIITERILFALAIVALSTSDHGGDEHPVADMMFLHPRSDLYDLAHRFVTQDISPLHARHYAVIEMHVRPADRGIRDSDFMLSALTIVGSGTFCTSTAHLPSQQVALMPHLSSPFSNK